MPPFTPPSAVNRNHPTIIRFSAANHPIWGSSLAINRRPESTDATPEIVRNRQTTPQNVTLHLKAIFEEGELTEAATCKDCLQVRQEAKREVSRSLGPYRLEAVLAVGYRVRSPRVTQFRQWATARLSEYLVKGFAMDDERLKNPGGRDYFNELNRLVVIFLEQAELRVKQQKYLTLDFWRASVDRMLSSNDQPLLTGPGSISHDAMKTIAAERYESFDAKRRKQEASEADAEDLKAIENLEKDLKRKGGKA